jgi:glycosyltransferase involved in cell wall biosynthesis
MTLTAATAALAAGPVGAARPRARVLHVITHLDNGGAQDNTLLTVELLDRGRYEVDLAAGPGVQEDRARHVADRLHVLRGWQRELGGGGDASALRELWRLCEGYDVVHTHGSKAGVLGRLAARARRVPAVVHTVHGFPVNPDTRAPVRAALLTAERLAARCAHSVICVCEANAREALQLRIATRHQLAVVVSGVPDPVAATDAGSRVRRELGIPPAAPVVGTVTRFMPQKAPLDFVAAAAALVAADAELHVLVVGDGPMQDEVAHAAAAVPRLHLLGHRADVPDLLDAMDVVAFSSRWEGLGRALTEAVLAGRPVVATAVNGVPDLVVHGRTGFLVPSGRPLDLADHVLRVLATPDRGRSLGAAGRARVDGQFSTQQMVEGIDALYARLLAARPDRPAEIGQRA